MRESTASVARQTATTRPTPEDTSRSSPCRRTRTPCRLPKIRIQYPPQFRGVTVFADQTQTVAVAHAEGDSRRSRTSTSRAAGNYVKPARPPTSIPSMPRRRQTFRHRRRRQPQQRLLGDRIAARRHLVHRSTTATSRSYYIRGGVYRPSRIRVRRRSGQPRVRQLSLGRCSRPWASRN